MGKVTQDLRKEHVSNLYVLEIHEETVIGHNVHEKLHAMIDDWAKTFDTE